MRVFQKYLPGVLTTILLALVSIFLSGLIPYQLISAGVFALLIGIYLNPLVSKYTKFGPGFDLTSKKVLRLAIILMGASLSFSQRLVSFPCL